MPSYKPEQHIIFFTETYFIFISRDRVFYKQERLNWIEHSKCKTIPSLENIFRRNKVSYSET